MSQGHAKIEFEADLSPAFEQVGPKLEAILTKLESVAKQVFAALETDAENAATSASAALDQIDGSGLDNISAAAETAAADTMSAIDNSMGEVQRALSAVDASGLSTIADAADAAAEQTTAAISSSTAAVTSSIDSIDASGFTNVSSAASTAAESVAGVATAAETAAATVADANSRASESFSDVDTQASKASAAIDGLGGLGTSSLGKMVGTLGAAVGGWKLFSGAIDRAGDTAAVEASLAALYGSAEDAADMMVRIARISDGSSIDTSAYQSLATGLGYLGVQGEQAENIMHNVGKAITGAGGDSSSLDSVVGALTNMQNQGKVTRESLAQLSGAGIPILDSLATGLGVEVPKVLEMATDGLLDVNQVMGVLEDGTGQWMERLIEGGDIVDETFGARWDRAKDQVMGALGDAILPAMESIAPLMTTGADALQGFITKVAGAGPVLAILAGIIGGTLVVAIGVAIAKFVALQVQSAWAATRSAAAWVASAATTAASWAVQGVKITAQFAMVAARAVASAAATAAAWVASAARTVAATVAQTTAFVATRAAMVAGAAATGIMTAAQWALNSAFLANPMTWVVAGIMALVAAIVLIATQTEWFEQLWSAIWDGITAAWEVTWEILQGGFDLFLGALSALGDAASWLWDRISEVLGWIGERFSSIGDIASSVAKFVSGVWDGMIGFFTGLPGRIAGIAGGMWDSVKTAVTGAKDWVTSSFDSLIGFVTGLPGRITSATSGMWDGIKDAFKAAINWIIDGWNGIRFTIPEIDTHIPGIGKVGGWSVGVPPIPRLADGGLISGPGGPRDDKIPALLSDGEFVINAAATERYLPLLRALNAQRFADGGQVGRKPMPAARGGDGASLDDPSGALLGVAGAAGLVSAAFDDAITDGAAPAWQALVDQLASTSEDTVLPVLGGMQEQVGQLGVLFPTTLDTVITPALTNLQAGLVQTGTVTAGVVQGTVIPQWATMGASILAVKTGTVDPVFAGIQGGLMTTAAAFGTGATAIAAQWSRVREATAAPVRFAITSVFNDGIVGMWNSVSDMLGTDRMAPYPLRFAVGGRVPGTGDTDSVPALLMPDEFVMSRPMIRAIGAGDLGRGLSMLETVRRATGQTGGIGAEGLFSAVAGRYSAGGVVQGTPAWERLRDAHSFASRHSGKPYVWGGSIGPSGGTDCSGFMSSIADVILGGSGLHRKWATGGFPGGGMTQTAMANVGGQSWAQGLAAGFSIGVSNVHTAGTLGGIDGLPTVNVESGGSPSRVKYGAGAVGADHGQFPTRWHLPIAAGAFVSGGQYGGSAVSFADIIGAITGPAREKIGNLVAGWPVRGLIDTYPGAMAETMTTAVDTKIDQLIEELSTFDDPGGSGVERWRPLVQLLLQRYQLGLEHTDRTLRRMNQESGGNPRAINLWDSNAQAGIPSKGLMQVIDPTFAAYRDPSLSPDIWDPMANVGASMRYAMATYGSLPAAYDRAGGYAHGGLLPEGDGWWHKTALEPERVLSPEQNAAFEELVAGLTRGQGGVNIGGVTIGAGGDIDIDPRRVTGGAYRGASSSSTSRTVLVTQHFHGPTDADQVGTAVEDRITALLP